MQPSCKVNRPTEEATGTDPATTLRSGGVAKYRYCNKDLNSNSPLVLSGCLSEIVILNYGGAMVRRIVLALLGVVLLVGTVYLGVLSAQDPSPVIVASFGLAATFLVPIGFTAVGYAWSAGTPDPLKELVKITEIDKKIAEANTLEERIRLLQDRQTKLTEVIQLETRHQAVLQRKEFLEQQGIRILSDLEAVDQECADLQLVVERTELDEDSRQELEQLRTRLEAKRRGDHVFRFGRHQFTLPGDVERFTFFGGPLVVPLLRIFETAYAVIWRDKRGTVK